jgi:hypothetical protein
MASQAIFDNERVLTPIGYVWVPVVRVRLRHGGNALDLDMTVDSGADLTMLPYQVGLNLGFRKGTSRMSRLSGIAGGAPYLLKKAGLEIATIRLRRCVAWAQTDDVPILLGRCDVFDRPTISFNGRERRVTFNG